MDESNTSQAGIVSCDWHVTVVWLAQSLSESYGAWCGPPAWWLL